MEGILLLNILCDEIIKLLGKLYKHIHASHTSILIIINVNVTCHGPFLKVISISQYGDAGLPFPNTLALWACLQEQTSLHSSFFFITSK